MLFASWPAPDTPPGTSSKGDSDPASSSDDSSVTPRYIYKILLVRKISQRRKIEHTANIKYLKKLFFSFIIYLLVLYVCWMMVSFRLNFPRTVVNWVLVPLPH